MTSRTPVYWRTKGGRKRAGTIDITRASSLAPSGWGNPFSAVEHGHDACVDMFAAMVAANPDFQARFRSELTGKRLACWCQPHQRCHGDVYIAVINGTDR